MGNCVVTGFGLVNIPPSAEAARDTTCDYFGIINEIIKAEQGNSIFTSRDAGGMAENWDFYKEIIGNI